MMFASHYEFLTRMMVVDGRMTTYDGFGDNQSTTLQRPKANPGAQKSGHLPRHAAGVVDSTLPNIWCFDARNLGVAPQVNLAALASLGIAHNKLTTQVSAGKLYRSITIVIVRHGEWLKMVSY